VVHRLLVRHADVPERFAGGQEGTQQQCRLLADEGNLTLGRQVLQALHEGILCVDVALDQGQTGRRGGGGLRQRHVDQVVLRARAAHETAALIDGDIDIGVVIDVAVEVAMLPDDAGNGWVEFGADDGLAADGQGQEDVQPTTGPDQHHRVRAELLEGQKADEATQPPLQLRQIPVEGHHVRGDLAVGVDVEVVGRIELPCFVGKPDNVGAREGIPLAGNDAGFDVGVRKLLVERLGEGVVVQRHEWEVDDSQAHIEPQQDAERGCEREAGPTDAKASRPKTDRRGTGGCQDAACECRVDRAGELENGDDTEAADRRTRQVGEVEPTALGGVQGKGAAQQQAGHQEGQDADAAHDPDGGESGRQRGGKQEIDAERVNDRQGQPAPDEAVDTTGGAPRQQVVNEPAKTDATGGQ
jgi:hypothetical protein